MLTLLSLSSIGELLAEGSSLVLFWLFCAILAWGTGDIGKVKLFFLIFLMHLFSFL